MVYMIGLRICAISMRSAILSILFILSRTEYATDALGDQDISIFTFQLLSGLIYDQAA
jgi:hypothetical protein